MHDDSVRRLGGVAAIVVGLSYVAAGIAALLMPPELQAMPDVTPHQFWTVLSQQPYAHLAFHWCGVVSGLAGLAALPAISHLVFPCHRGVVLWASALAWLGFAVQARSHLMEVAFDRKIIPFYLDADPAWQQAVHVVAGLALDIPDGFLTYGALGFWVLVVSRLALRDRILPLSLCYLGLAAAFTYLLGVIGYTFFIRWALVISIGAGGLLLVPAWFIWLGIRLLRQRDELAC